MVQAPPASVGEVKGFVDLLAAACNDAKVNAALERLLSMPNAKRQALVHAWVTDLLMQDAPRDFVQAIACLEDDAVAEKAYEVIFKCSRGDAP